jgi:hypothetical protein
MGPDLCAASILAISGSIGCAGSGIFSGATMKVNGKPFSGEFLFSISQL